MKHKIKKTQHWCISSVITKTESGMSMHNNWLELKLLMQVFAARY